MKPLERLISDNPFFHEWPDGAPANWAARPAVLNYMSGLLHPGMTTLETGAGQSTLVFVIAGTCHYAITNQPNEPERIQEYCRKSGIEGDLHFLIGSSDIIFSHNGVIPEALDFVFIDGAHRFPFPALDWHYTEGRLKIGGVLGIDDIDIPSVRIVHDFLSGEEEWELMNIIGKTSFFSKTGIPDISFDHQGQKLNRFKVPGCLKFDSVLPSTTRHHD